MSRTRKRAQGKAANSFYTKVNGRRQTVIPDTETRITPSYYIQKEINHELATLVTDLPFYASVTRAEGRIPTGLSSLIAMAMTTDTVAGFIGWMNRHGIPAPLSVYVTGDIRHNTMCRIAIEPGPVRIGHASYWHKADKRRAYAHYVDSLAGILSLPILREGLAAEHEMAGLQPANVESEDYTTMNESTLRTTFRGIDWTSMMRNYGSEGTTFMVIAPFLHHVQARLTSWPIQRWRALLTLSVVQWIAGCSPRGPLRSAWFAYNRRFLEGQIADDPAATLRTTLTCYAMPNTVGKLWVARYCDPAVRQRGITMVEVIVRAAIATLKESWMAASTKAAAIHKLRHMDLQVGWPSPWPTTPVVIGDDYVDNLLEIGAASTDEALKMRSCRHMSGSGWDRPVFDVNAYYYPAENRFVLPAAILRPPYYDPARSLSYNYGAIGATIGHELCHAFDSDGREYDEEGNKRVWWTAHDDREYRKKARQLVRLFESRRYRGMPVDGKLTLVENLADLGGLGFALAGLRSVTTVGPHELREFFTSYASSWRSADRRKAAAQRLIIDSHAPPMLRVDHIVRQFDEWYEAFDVGPDSSEWIAPANRIRLFT
jgi:endothelin-converting enzyme/putative endopeptidase